MKKNLIIASIVLLLCVLAATGYWYWQQQNPTTTSVDTLQTVALDNPDIDSFDDVCTAGENGALNCKGNIEQFGCAYYRIVSADLTALRPIHPIIRCLINNDVSSPGGVYQLQKTAYLPTRNVNYIIIKDNTFQLIQSVDELQRVYQPIESIDEAKAYFSILGKGVLVLDEDTLSTITSPQVFHNPIKGAKFDIPVDSIGLSKVTETTDGYILRPYSAIPVLCVDEVYLYTFLLTADGQLIEQDKQLIWEMINKPSCSS